MKCGACRQVEEYYGHADRGTRAALGRFCFAADFVADEAEEFREEKRCEENRD